MSLARRSSTLIAISLMAISVIWLAFRLVTALFSEPVVADGGSLAQVYFSAPYLLSASSQRGGADHTLAAALDNAQESVDLAAYDLEARSIRDALLQAHARGVRVRLVVESDNMLEPAVQALKSAGVPVLGDRGEALMHHKFAVVDQREVWTGSMNFTTNGSYLNLNNLISIQSLQLAANYRREFEEMFLENRFGPASASDTPYPRITLEDSLVQVFFSPDDGVASALIDLLSSAAGSIRFLAFSFTSDPIGDAIIAAAERGVEVIGVMESSQARGQGSEFVRMREAGIDVRLDEFEGHMHHKVMIIDEAIVVTGSYNFSRSAEERNDENVLILHDPGLAELYIQEFERVLAGPP